MIYVIIIVLLISAISIKAGQAYNESNTLVFTAIPEQNKQAKKKTHTQLQKRIGRICSQ